MQVSAFHHSRVAPSAAAASAVAELLVDESDHDMPGVLLPGPGLHLVVRFGPATRSGLAVHTLGVRPKMHRRLMHGAQRAVTARLHLGAHEAVLGVPALSIVGKNVPIEELWGAAASRRLYDRLGDAHSMVDAAAILASSIAERLGSSAGRCHRQQLALDAAEKLRSANVKAVASERTEPSSRVPGNLRDGTKDIR